MNATGYAFLGLTALVAVLVAVLAFAVLRFFAAARDARRQGAGRHESVLLATTLEEAIARLKTQERAMAARADASDHLRTEIVAGLTSGLIVVDGDGVAQVVNPAARRIVGLRADAPAHTVFDEAPALRPVIEQTLRSGEPMVRVTVTVDRAGEPMHLGVTVSPLAADRGSGGAICLFSDLTAVVAMEEQLRLKEALARLGELTAGLAHEFRNGLATIHGYARLIDPATLPNDERRYIEGIRAETDSLGAVVTNFLNFAKPQPLALAPVDVSAIIARAADDAAPGRITMQGEFGVVAGDDILLRQAFSNLFRNSVEACGGAGVTPAITVTGALDPAQRMVTIAISDNGPGLAGDAIPRLFQPFFSRRPGGTGLGLAIVQKIIVSHNGRVSAANQPGGGAVFHIGLPLHSLREAPEM